ncbi:cysteine hydrolase family protein [Streptococcus cameli]
MAVKALISIDYTYDFVSDDGKLTAGKIAQAISERMAEVTEAAYRQGDYIFFAIDLHEEQDSFHPESCLFPPHNIVGTPGRTLFGPLAEVYESIKDDARVVWLDKRYYSAFSGTDLDIRLRERGVKTVVLTGVLSDICVLHTAIDAYNLGYEIEIIGSAIASITEEAHAFALNHFEHVLGATILP